MHMKMRFAWIFLLLSTGLLVAVTECLPEDEGTGESDSRGDGNTDDPSPPPPKPVESKPFPNVFNIEKLLVLEQIGFKIGVEYIAKQNSRFAEEVYLKEKKGGQGEDKDDQILRSKLRLRKKDSDQTIIMFEDDKKREVFDIHEGRKGCEIHTKREQLKPIFDEIENFFPDGFERLLKDIRIDFQNKDFYLGPAALLFQLGNQMFKEGDITYIGRTKGHDVDIPAEPEKEDGDGGNGQPSAPLVEDESGRNRWNRKELDTWQGDVRLKPNNRPAKITFKFSLDEMDEAEGLTRQLVPIPISFEVEYLTGSEDGPPQIASLYFSGFRHFKDGEDQDFPEINVPHGYGCTRFSDKVFPAPNPPPSFFDQDFDVEMEIVTSACGDKYLQSCTESIFNSKMHHIRSHKLMSIEQTVISLLGNQNRKEMKYIIDFNEKVRYDIDIKKSSCESRPVFNDFERIHEPQQPPTESIWDYTPALDVFQDIQRLKLFQPKFFSVQEPDSFLGYTTRRDVRVLTYEGKYSKEFVTRDGTNERILDILVTKHFIDDKRTETEGSILTNNSPTEIVFRVIDPEGRIPDTSITINIHKFRVDLIEHEVVNHAFDVTPCFKGHMQSIWFQTVFPLQEQFALELMMSERAVENAFRDAMGELPPHRLPVVIVDTTTDFIIVSAQLLDRPVEIFDVVANKQIKHARSDVSNSMLIESPQLCERKCLDSVSSGICTAFSFCQSLECDLHVEQQTTNMPEPPVETADGCYTYKKRVNVPNNVFGEEGITLAKHSITGVLDEIQKMVNSVEGDGKLKIILDRVSNEGKKSQEVSASMLVRNVDPGFIASQKKRDKDKEDNLSTLLEGYKIFKRNSEFASGKEDLTKNKMTLLVGMTPKECARLCDEDESCKSFSTCTDKTMNCVLASQTYDDIKDDMIAGQVRFPCTLMTKTFLYDYDEMEKMKLSKAAKVAISIPSAEACAKDCSGRSEFECRSFDFCLDTSGDVVKYACMLHESHIFRTNENEQKVDLDLQKTECNHYSRAYTRDFKIDKLKHFKESVGVSTTISGTSAEECARECASDEDNDCYHFEFCEKMTSPGKKPDRVCRFAKGSAVPTVEANQTCRVYSIKSKVLRAPKPKPPPPTTDVDKKPIEEDDSKAPTGVSPTVAVFFSLFFVALAAVGGVFGFKYYQRWRENRVDSPA